MFFSFCRTEVIMFPPKLRVFICFMFSYIGELINYSDILVSLALLVVAVLVPIFFCDGAKIKCTDMPKQFNDNRAIFLSKIADTMLLLLTFVHSLKPEAIHLRVLFLLVLVNYQCKCIILCGVQYLY